MPINLTISTASHRWIVCALCSLAITLLKFENLYSFNLYIVASLAMNMNRLPSAGCPFHFSGSVWERSALPVDLPDVYWNPLFTSIAFSAYDTSLILTCIPAGLLADVGLSRYVIGGGMLLLAACKLILSTFKSLDDTLYFFINIFEGVGRGLIYPSIFTLISHWSLPSKRNWFTALIVSGSIYGKTLGTLFFNSNYLTVHSWRTGHIISCICTILWLGFGFIFIHNSPAESPFIRQHEDHNSNKTCTLHITLMRLKTIPWWRVATSIPFLSFLLAFCSVDWIAWENIYTTWDYQSYILYLPKRFSDKSKVMVMSAVPAVLMAGYLADWIVQHDLMSKTAVKKTFSFTGVFLASLLQIAATLVGCNIILFWILSISAAFVLGLAVPVIFSSPIDLSWRHAGLQMGIMSSARVLCYRFLLQLDRLLLTDEYSWEQWRNRFLFYSAFSLAMMVPFIFLGSGEDQRWGGSRRPHLRTASRSESHLSREAHLRGTRV